MLLKKRRKWRSEINRISRRPIDYWAKSIAAEAQAWEKFINYQDGPFFYKVLLNINLKCNVLYKSWALTKRQNQGTEQFGEAQRSPRGSTRVFACIISIGELDKVGDFFPDRFVRVWYKKNYLLLQKEITSFLLEKALWKVSNAVLWICWMWTISFSAVVH